MNGYLGQQCPDCRRVMDLNENRESRRDDKGALILGRQMYSLTCQTHGRHTEWYIDRDDALNAPVVFNPARHTAAIDKAPPPALVVKRKREPRSGKEITEEHIEAEEQRLARK